MVSAVIAKQFKRPNKHRTCFAGSVLANAKMCDALGYLSTLIRYAGQSRVIVRYSGKNKLPCV
jgi:hypothetical protein